MGMVVGAREHIRWLFNETYQQSLQMGKNAFGVDQIVANYLLRSKSGQCELTPLAADYNYIVLAYLDSLRVEGPLILDGKGEAPPIIHNLGGTSRPIKGPWLKVRQDHRLYTSFEIERICRCWMRQGPNRNLLLAAMKAWGRAPAVATCQMLRQLALGVLPKSWVQFIVTLKKKGKG